MRLLLTHGERTNERVARGLAPYGIDCTTFETTGRVYTLDERVDADVGLVYPSRLPEGGVVDALGEISWINGEREVLKTRNKARTLALLNAADVPVPDTRFVSNPADTDAVSEAFESVGAPAVVKPNSASSGHGATVVHDTDSVTGVADLFGVVHESSLVRDRTFLIQEYVKDARDYRVMVTDGDYVGAVERRAEGWKKNVRVGAEARGVEPPESVVEVAVTAARALNVPFCGVDVLFGDSAVVNEVNARPTVDRAEKYEDGFYARLARLVKNTSDTENG